MRHNINDNQSDESTKFHHHQPLDWLVSASTTSFILLPSNFPRMLAPAGTHDINTSSKMCTLMYFFLGFFRKNLSTSSFGQFLVELQVTITNAKMLHYYKTCIPFHTSSEADVVKYSKEALPG